MRLINADSLLVNMENGMQGTAREYLKFYQMAVNDEPTAYDVNKVLVDLKDSAIAHAIVGQQYEVEGVIISSAEERAISRGLNVAIEIVKRHRDNMDKTKK